MTAKKRENEIRELMDKWAAAVAAKNVDAILENYDENVVVFDVPPPMKLAGRDEYRRDWDDWLTNFTGAISVDFDDTRITAGEDVAFVSTLTRVRNEDAPDSGSWVRVTVGYKKTSGKWLVTHEHASIPAGMQQ
ncbi:MAG: SgcJ/EcaC family oxidoreductase [Acidobacteriota bacterium]